MIIFNTFFSRIMGIEAVKRQSIISFVWQIIFTAIGFVSTMYFAHAVGASVLGAYFLFLAYYGITDMVADGGFGGAAIKRISEGEEPDAFFSAFFVLRSVFATTVLVVLIAFQSHLVDIIQGGTFFWLLLALVASLLYGAVSTGVAGRGKMGIRATCSFMDNVSRVVVQVIGVFSGYGVAGLAGGFVAGMLTAAIIEWRFFDLHLVRFKWKHIKSLSTFSFWLFLTSSGMMVFSYADTVLIGYFLNNADVGVYRVVMQFTSFAVFTTAAFRGTLWPKVSRWGKTGEIRSIENSLARACSYSFILAIPIFFGGVLLGDKLIYFFYGAEFSRGYPVLVVLLILQLANIFQVFFTLYLSALDHQKEAFKVTVIAVIANIILDIFLIPIMGIFGAALATLITMLLNVILAKSILSKIMHIQIEKDSLTNILKASFYMSLVVGSYRLLVPLSSVWLTIIPVIMGGIVYVILILKFDSKICDEFKGIFIQMNVPWPSWL